VVCLFRNSAGQGNPNCFVQRVFCYGATALVVNLKNTGAWARGLRFARDSAEGSGIGRRGAGGLVGGCWGILAAGDNGLFAGGLRAQNLTAGLKGQGHTPNIDSNPQQTGGTELLLPKEYLDLFRARARPCEGPSRLHEPRTRRLEKQRGASAFAWSRRSAPGPGCSVGGRSGAAPPNHFPVKKAEEWGFGRARVGRVVGESIVVKTRYSRPRLPDA